MRHESPFAHAGGGAIGETDEVERAGQVRTLDAVAPRQIQHSITEQSRAARPVHVVETVDDRTRSRVVMVGNGGRKTKDRGDRSAGLFQPHRSLGCREMNGLACKGPLGFISMTGRPAPATVGRGRVAISLVDGLPAGNEVAKGCSHVLDVAGLDIRAVGLDQKSTRSGELPGQGEVMKADPRLDAGVSSSEEHRSIMVDEGFVVHALLGFEPRPLDREAMMAQPEAGQNREISRALPRESVAIAR